MLDIQRLYLALVAFELEYSLIKTIKFCASKHETSRTITKYIFTLVFISASTFCTPLPSQATTPIKVAYGKISLIDLGSLITNEPLILDKSLANIYTLSGLEDENNKSIIAIQGLKQNGSTDLTVRTKRHIHQFHIILDPSKREDLILNIENSRSKILNSQFKLDKQRLTLVTLPAYINEYVLAGNPNLISLQQVVGENDPEYLKTFALSSKNKTGETDIVIASKSGVYKFTITIGDSYEHTENISLYQR